MVERFEIVGTGSSRPNADRIIFCDGTGGSLYQPEIDLELSHWRPNRTPVEYRAGTSTEICFRFLDKPRSGSWTAAVNNHLDADGVLSVYTLVEDSHAQANRRSIIEAAEIGDFWGWGETPAQRVFQGITLLMERARHKGLSTKAVYEEAFRRIPALIDGSDPQLPEIDLSLTPLRHGVQLVESGQIVRSLIGIRLAHYVVPLSVTGDDNARASYAPEFNESISAKAVLWPQVRARWDAERICLVSVERATGWFHDLCFPGYLWADTEGRWLVPGLTYHDGMSSYGIQHPALIAAVRQLQSLESAPGQWGLGGTSLPFGDDLQAAFPVVGRFVNDEGRPAISRMAPDQLAKVFVGVFQ